MASLPLPVEVRGEYGEHYPASMLKLFPDGVLVTFQTVPLNSCDSNPENSKAPLTSIVIRNCATHKFPLKVVRVASPRNEGGNGNGAVQDFHVGDRVEVWFNSTIFVADASGVNGLNENPAGTEGPPQPMAWWDARVTKATKDLLGVAIHHPSGTRQTSEIVDRSQVRPFNNHPYLTPQSLHTRIISLSPTMKFNLEEPGVVDLVRRLPGLVLVDSDEAGHQLNFVSPDREVIRRVALLEETFLRFMQQKQNLTSQWSRRVEEKDNVISEVFSVDSDLIGMAIGQQGHNIDEARNVPGILSVFLDDATKTFHVVGKTREAVKEAREKLEFMRDIIYVPDAYTSRIIGRNGQMLQEVVDKSQVIRVYVPGGLNDEGTDFVFPNGVAAAMKPGFFPFQVVGRRSQLEDARLLIDFQVDMLKQMDEQSSTSTTLASVHQRRGSGGPLNNFPPPRPYNAPSGAIEHRESSLPPSMNFGRFPPRGGRLGQGNFSTRGGPMGHFNGPREDDNYENGQRSGYATDPATIRPQLSQDERVNRIPGRQNRGGRSGRGGRKGPGNGSDEGIVGEPQQRGPSAHYVEQADGVGNNNNSTAFPSQQPHQASTNLNGDPGTSGKPPNHRSGTRKPQPPRGNEPKTSKDAVQLS